MKPHFPNALINPHFENQDYGTALRNSTGYVVTRTKLERTGTAGAITAQPGITSSNSALAKAFRSRACIDMVVTAASYNPATDTGILRQRVPDSDRFGRQRAHFRVVAFGPDGGSFDMGLNGATGFTRRHRRVVTQGNTAGGTPIPTTITLDEHITDLPSEYITAEYFSNPADEDASFKIAYVHLEFLGDKEDPSHFIYSPAWLERERAEPYLWVCPQWHEAVGGAGETVVTTVSLSKPMTATPTIVQPVSSSAVTRKIAGTDVTSAAPSFGFDAVPNKSPRGGRIASSGYVGLTSGTLVVHKTVAPFALEAEI